MGNYITLGPVKNKMYLNIVIKESNSVKTHPIIKTHRIAIVDLFVSPVSLIKLSSNIIITMNNFKFNANSSVTWVCFTPDTWDEVVNYRFYILVSHSKQMEVLHYYILHSC